MVAPRARRGQTAGAGCVSRTQADLDIELISGLFVGSVLVRTVMRPDATLDEDLVEHIVDTVLEGLRPGGA